MAKKLAKKKAVKKTAKKTAPVKKAAPPKAKNDGVLLEEIAQDLKDRIADGGATTDQLQAIRNKIVPPTAEELAAASAGMSTVDNAAEHAQDPAADVSLSMD